MRLPAKGRSAANCARVAAGSACCAAPIRSCVAPRRRARARRRCSAAWRIPSRVRVRDSHIGCRRCVDQLSLRSWCLLPVAGRGAGRSRPERQPPRGVVDPPEKFTTRVVASGFEDPWEVTWGPDGYLWITERVGKRVVRVNPADGSRKVAVTIDEVLSELAQDGLLGLALHPELLRGSNYVYVMYTYDADPGPADGAPREDSALHVRRDLAAARRARRRADEPAARPRSRREPHRVRTRRQALCEPRRPRLEFPGVLLRSDPRAGAADGRGRSGAQLARYEGKILRVNLDGSIPGDNPVLERRAQPRVHLRASQPSGHGLRARRAALRIRARPRHGRRGEPHRGGPKLRLAVDRRLQGRSVLHVRELVRVGADAVRELGLRPRHAEHGAAHEGVRRESRATSRRR